MSPILVRKVELLTEARAVVARPFNAPILPSLNEILPYAQQRGNDWRCDLQCATAVDDSNVRSQSNQYRGEE